MDEITCDVAIIGAGTAGLAAYAAATKAGAKTVLIEAGAGGTTCAKVGCMPSKLLIAAARAAHDCRQAALFGIEIQGVPKVNSAEVFARVRRERDYFVGSVLKDVARIPAASRLTGHARFVGPRTLQVDDTHRISAKAIIIAAGSSSTIPEPLQSVAHHLVTNETIFELQALPRSLGVIGSGPLGIELAQAFARLGVQTIVFDKVASVGGLKDPAVIEAACKILGREIDLRLGTSFQAQPDDDQGVKLSWIRDTSYGTHSVEMVLSAAGRPPNLGALDLDKADIELDDHGVPKFDQTTMRCGESSIFIVGDANADRAVLHSASHEGKIAGTNAAYFPETKPDKRNPLLAMVFTDPGIASVGPAFSTLKAEDIAIGRANVKDNGRARIQGRDAGLIHLYADRKDGTVLGGEIVAPGAEHLAHLLCWAVEMKLTASALANMPYYHPTLEEVLQSAARDLASALAASGR